MQNQQRRLLGLLTLALLSVRPSAFAQGARRADFPPPAAPKVTLTPTDAWHPRSSAYIKASNTRADAQFGYAIALSGDGNTLAVGAVGEDSTTKGVNGVPKGHAEYTGAVYLYTRATAGWKRQAYVKASNPRENAQFGISVSLNHDGNLLAVGSSGESSSAKGINGNQEDTSMDSAGAVYIFARDSGNWSQQAYIKASNTGGPEDGYQFGYAISLSSDGSTLAVGSMVEPSGAHGTNGDQSDTSAPGSGAVYVFTHNGANWSQQAYIKPWNTTGALFGYAVALSGNGDTLAVGSQNEDGTRGGAYVFGRRSGVWSQETHFGASNAEADDQLGCSIAISDDGNTMVSGACEEDAVLTGIQPPNAGAHDRDADDSTGAVYVFVRKDGRWSQQTYMKSFNTRVNDQFGWGVAISGDGNTIAVGAHFEDSGATGINGNQSDFSAEDSGAVYIYTRNVDSWSPAAYVKPSNPQNGAMFGDTVAISADGKVLAVPAPRENSAAKGINGHQHDNSAKFAGAVYVYY
jgi:trimeric autotransporter adhesin